MKGRILMLDFKKVLTGAAFAALAAIGLLSLAGAGEFEDAQSLFQSQQYGRAVEIYTKLLKDDTQNVHIMFNLGTALNFTGEQTRAVEILNRAVVSAESQTAAGSFENELLGHIYAELSFTYINSERYDEAVVSAQKGIDKYPALSKLYYAQGEAYRLKDLYESAISSYQKVLNIDPADTSASLRVAKCFFDMKRYDSAENLLREQVKNYPQNTEMKFNLGSALFKMEKKDEAIKIWKEIASAEPGSEFGHRAGQWLSELGVGTSETLLPKNLSAEAITCSNMGFSFVKPANYYMTKSEDDQTSSIYMAGRGVFDEVLKKTAEISLSISGQILDAGAASDYKEFAKIWKQNQQKNGGSGFQMTFERDMPEKAAAMWEYEVDYEGTKMKGATMVSVYKNYGLLIWLNATANTYAKVKSDFDLLAESLKK